MVITKKQYEEYKAEFERGDCEYACHKIGIEAKPVTSYLLYQNNVCIGERNKVSFDSLIKMRNIEVVENDNEKFIAMLYSCKRNLLYRGYALDCKEWVYGNLNRYESSDYIEENEISIPVCFVGQYIGINDKNNVKIFEKDIVLIGTQKFIVIYDEENARFVLRTINVNKIILDFTYFDTNTPIEVIGNVYDSLNIIEEELVEKC